MKYRFPRSLGSLIGAGVLFAWAAGILAQAPVSVFGQEAASEPVSKVERKNRAPVSTDILRVNLPKPIEAKLTNGLTVLIVEDHRFPVVFAQFHVNGAGALFEPRNLAGLASATAQMLREGTRTYTTKQIAEKMERLGATITASAEFGSSEAELSTSGLSDNFDAWFTLATEVLLHPTFPADELAKLSQRAKVQLHRQRSSAGFLAHERFSQAVFGAHPAAVVSPTPESLDALTPEALMKWHRERYVPNHAILGIAGDVRAAEIIPKLERWLANWQPKGGMESWPANPAPAAARRIYLVDRPNSVQTTVVLGNIAVDRRSPDYIPMRIMNHILGGGAAARLFLNLREEKGYTYGVYSSFTAVEYPGPWRAGGNMRTEVTEAALGEFYREIRRIREEPVTRLELEEAKRSVVANFALALERPARLLGFAITRKIYNLPSDYWDTYPEKIMAVTADDVRRVARRYLNPETMQLVAVGDVQKIRSVLEKYGSVRVYDSAGRSLPAAKH